MALDEINEYPNTATAIVTGSFFDIDMLIGTGTWQSQKVPYSVMQTFIGDNSVNFSNTDLTFTGNRTHDTDGNNLLIGTDGGVYAESWLWMRPTATTIGWSGQHYDEFTTSAVKTFYGGNERVTINATETIINQDGISLDFRVEGNTDANLFFADASTDRVGIGTSTPTAKLNIDGGGELIHIGDTSFTDKWMEIRPGTTGLNFGFSTGLNSGNGGGLIKAGGTKGFGVAVNDTSDFSTITDSDLAFFIDDAGDVGIGTGTPLAKLHVECLNDDGLLLASTSAGNDVDQSAIYFATSSGATSGIKGHRGNTSTNVGLRFDVSGKADALIINPDGTFIGLPFEQTYAISDEVFDLITGTAKLTFRMPHAVTLTDVRASVSTAPTGSTIIVDINQTASTILSTKLTIDATEKTSTTAATPPVISTSALTDDAEITIDIDQVGSTIAGVGLKVTLIGTRA
jgi:hypothetical protein